MRKFVVLCLLLVVVCGCSRRKQAKASPVTDDHYAQMALDTAYRLQASYLPAHTSFAFHGATDSDVFSVFLASKLREMGFSVNEGGDFGPGIPVNPQVFVLGDREAVVVVAVGDRQLQRGFSLLETEVAPSSYWMVRRESNGG